MTLAVRVRTSYLLRNRLNAPESHPYFGKGARLPTAGVLARCEPYQINYFWQDASTNLEKVPDTFYGMIRDCHLRAFRPCGNPQQSNVF